jgi:hypothetical protein
MTRIDLTKVSDPVLELDDGKGVTKTYKIFDLIEKLQEDPFVGDPAAKTYWKEFKAFWERVLVLPSGTLSLAAAKAIDATVTAEAESIFARKNA